MLKTILNDELTGRIRQMKYLTTDQDDTNYGFEISHYDERGHLTRWESFDEYGEPAKNLVYLFDDNGILQQETLSWSDGTIMYSHYYYPNGHIRETREYYNEELHKTLYDEAGNVKHSSGDGTDIDMEEDPYNEQWEKKLGTDEDGSPVELEYYYSFGSLFEITKRKYDEHRQVIMEATFAGENELIANTPRSVTTSEYNIHRHLVTQTNEELNGSGEIRRTIFRYAFQYDTQNNWVEKVEIMNNHITGYEDSIRFIRKREIEYIQ